VHGIDRKTGKGLWTFRTRGKVDSSPVICDGKVIVGSEDGRLYVLSLSDGKERSAYQIGRPVMSSPYIVNGLVLVGADDGFVHALRATN
jgi:outer membrane protein assembly factor BamB